MYLPDSLSSQLLFNNCGFFLTKLSQLLDGFLPFAKVAQLVVNTLELIHFCNILDNTQERVHTS